MFLRFPADQGARVQYRIFLHGCCIQPPFATQLQELEDTNHPAKKGEEKWNWKGLGGKHFWAGEPIQFWEGRGLGWRALGFLWIFCGLESP